MSLKEGLQIPINKVTSIEEIILTWEEMKTYYDNLGSKLAFINFFEFEDYYYIWMTFRDQKFYLPKLFKGTPECSDFETNYKYKSNIPEAPRIRITTNQLGRRMHSRFITFETSDQDNYDNTDWKDNPYNDVTYTMVDPEGNITLDPKLCKETYIDWMPSYDYELSGGTLFIPKELDYRVISIESISISGGIATANTLENHYLRKNSMITISGVDQDNYNGLKKVLATPTPTSFTFKVEDIDVDATGTSIQALEGDDSWEIHAVGVPDIPEIYGGNVHFIANPRIKWVKGEKLFIDAGLNPAELSYTPGMPTNKIRFVVKHPIGARSEFQINLVVYR